MRTLKFSKFNPKYWMLTRKNRQFQYQTEYEKIIDECDGDTDITELIMFLKKEDPLFEKESLLPGDRPELKLIKLKNKPIFKIVA